MSARSGRSVRYGFALTEGSHRCREGHPTSGVRFLRAVVVLPKHRQVLYRVLSRAARGQGERGRIRVREFQNQRATAQDSQPDGPGAETGGHRDPMRRGCVLLHER